MGIGIESAFQENPWLLCLLGIVLCPFLEVSSLRALTRPLLGLLIGSASFWYASASYQFANFPESGKEGVALLKIEQLNYKASGHVPTWIYRGKIKQFWPEGNNKETDADVETISLKNVPFTLILNKHASARALADQNYLVKGRITPSYGRRVVIKPASQTPWVPVPNTASLAEWRHKAKSNVSDWIQKNYQSADAASFLAGLLIGEFDDPQLVRDFGRFGLLHLLAISGFHFSILAQLLGTLGRILFKPKILAFILMGALSGYFFFLGWGPSILRAWMTILIFYGGSFNARVSSPLNSLGIALLFSLICDPLLLENLGFQFSFLTTAAILTFSKTSAAIVERIFPKREREIYNTMPLVSRHAYILLNFTMSSLVLTMATTIVALPISLYYFQQFPLLSLISNLFFPFLVSISMILMLLGILFSPLPMLSSQFHLLNDYFTSFILNLTYNIPEDWDIIITTPPFPPYYVIIFVALIFIWHIYSQKSINQLQLSPNR